MGFIGKTNSSLANKATPFSMAESMPVQTKLSVSKTSDPAEKEADNVARKVVDEQKDKKTASKKGDKKTDEAVAMPVAEATPDTKNENVKTKEDKDKPNLKKKEDPKKDIQKKEEQKEEKKAAKKEAGDDKKEKIAKQDDAKKEVRKKTEQKEEKKAAKKDNPENKKDNVAKKEDKKQEVHKKSEQKEEKKAARKEDNNKDKKPVDKEKETNARPKSVSLKEAPGKEEKPKIQQKPEEKKPVQALGKKDNDKAPQTGQQNEDPGDETKLQALEEKINARRGKGNPLSDQVKSEMEQSFSHDFSKVSIHQDKESAELCASLNAHAFAIGNDIFFNTGKYDPESDHGKELLAHELTHVVQQKDQVQRMEVRRKKGAAGGKPKGKIDGDKITLPKLEMPKLKKRNSPKIGNSVERKKGYDRDKAMKGEKSQTSVWKQNADVTAGVQDTVDKLKAKAGKKPSSPDIYFLKWESIKLFGTEKQLVENSKVPLWNKAGKVSAYDVDHIKELQLIGTNDIGNMELLNFSSNRGSGSVIDKKIRDAVNTFISEQATKDEYGSDVPKDVEKALKKYTIAFDSVVFTENIAGEKDNDYWSFDDIKGGKHLKKFEKMNKKEIEDIAGDEDNPVAYTSEIGGAMMKKSNLSRMPGFKGDISLKKGKSGDIAGSINGKFNPNPKIFEPLDLSVNLYRMDAVDFGGYIKRRAQGGNLETILSNLKVKGLSPVEIDSADMVPDAGIMVKGRINPSVSILGKDGIGFTIIGNDIEISKTFYAGEVNIPSPFKINDGSLSIFAGTNGFGVRGDLNFEIQNVGKGKVSGEGKSSGLFMIKGNFEFDKKIFNKADVEISYTHAGEGDDKWEVKGNIQIPQGKIRGVKKADISVSYDGTTLKANGNADFDIPGIEHGKLDVTYTNEQMEIEGEVDLKHKLIKSGNVKAKVEKKGEEYNVSLSGKAQPNIPGVETELSVNYVDGIITISGTVGYSKGRLSGSVTVGVTNQAVGADGKPSGTAGKSLTAFGGGSLTLRITDWLQGTAGVMLKPDGSIEVVGKIGIPGVVNIFEKKEIKKEIFKAPTIEIPIFAIPVGSRSIGLVGTIGGGADAYASIGPGQLTEAAVEVTYNPSHEEDMKVSGNAKFRVPAEAGLRLYVRAGIGLSVGIARVSGGIELGGALGIEGAAEAGVQVNWSPTQGFKLDAEASLSVQPKFKFDINAYIEAVLDLWVTEFSKEWKWNLYAFEYGPALRFGVKFPVHYEENKPFEISLNDVQFETPEINVADFAKGIGKQLVG